MDNALVLFETEPAFREDLKRVLSAYNVVFNEGTDTNKIDKGVAANTTIIFGSPKLDLIKLCPRLQWVQLQSAGANGYIDGELQDSVKLTCASGCYGHAVSEHMLALTITLLKKLHLYRDEQAKSRWQDRGVVKSIQDAVVVVIGCGDIGSNYARRMKALGSYVIGVDRYAYKKFDFLDEFVLADKMEDVLPRADVVALIVPGVQSNSSLIGKAQLAKMKKDAVIVNCGRGTSIDTAALCDALESGKIGAAGLEVTDPEPLPSDHKLWKLENALITPHVAGGRHLRNTTENIMKLNLENARRFLKGEAMESVVNIKTGYRFPKE